MIFTTAVGAGRDTTTITAAAARGRCASIPGSPRRRTATTTTTIAAGTTAIRFGADFTVARRRLARSVRGTTFAGRRAPAAGPRCARRSGRDYYKSGFYNPTFYEKLYDEGEARGCEGTTVRARAGTTAVRMATRAVETTAGRTGSYGMDTSKRARDYRRMLGENGEYFKLGSLGGDTETEEHVRARGRREAIRELDREVREQNRAAAERARRGRLGKTGEAGEGGAAEGFQTPRRGRGSS